MPTLGFEAECQECKGILYRGPLDEPSAMAAKVAAALKDHPCNQVPADDDLPRHDDACALDGFTKCSACRKQVKAEVP